MKTTVFSFKPSQNKITTLDVCLKFVAKCSEYSMTGSYLFLFEKAQITCTAPPTNNSTEQNINKHRSRMK